MHMAPAGIAQLVAPLMAARLSAIGCYQLAVVFGALCSLVLMQVVETNVRSSGESSSGERNRQDRLLGQQTERQTERQA